MLRPSDKGCKNPSVSIIIPVYNAEGFLGHTLCSILQQTESDYEIIQVDDGSWDGSGAVCDDYAARDDRILVIHQPNAGVSSARNRGMDASIGEYIMFCDSDDHVSAEWLEQLLTGIRQPGAELSVCGICNEYEGVPTDRLIPAYPDMTALPRSTFWDLKLQKLTSSACNKCFMRRIINEFHIRYETGLQLYEDELFVMEYISHMSGCITARSTDLYFYVKNHSDSLTHRYVKNQWAASLHCLDVQTRLLEDVGTPVDSIRESFYTYWNWRILSALSNYSNPNNPLTDKEKAAWTRTILRSALCKRSFRYGKIEDVSRLYAAVLHTRSPLIYSSFIRLVNSRK